MSWNKTGMIFFSSFLIFATTPSSPAAQGTQTGTTQKETASKQDTSKTNTASKEDIRKAQQALKDKGMYMGAVDGTMNAQTQKALREFQQKNKLQVTGTLNHETLMALGITSEPHGKAVTGENQPSTTEPKEGTKKEKGGTHAKTSGALSRGRVREVQTALKNQGFDPGPVDGIMGPLTMTALRNFQSHNQMPVTGMPDKRTTMALGISTTTQDPGTARNPVSSEYGDRDKDKTSQAGKPDKDISERVSKAVEVLQDLTSTPDKRIPNELLNRAEAIAVIPNVIKGALGFGGRFGKGLVSQRLDSGAWSAPAFLEIGGGSFGAQIGVSSTDLVLVFTDKSALKLLEGGKDLKLGADASIVAGPVGRSAEAGVNINLETAIYSYSRSKGLFAGVALDGSVLDIDNSANKKAYNQSLTAKQILSGSVAVNSTVRPFVDALGRIMPKKKISQR